MTGKQFIYDVTDVDETVTLQSQRLPSPPCGNTCNALTFASLSCDHFAEAKGWGSSRYAGPCVPVPGRPELTSDGTLAYGCNLWGPMGTMADGGPDQSLASGGQALAWNVAHGKGSSDVGGCVWAFSTAG